MKPAFYFLLSKWWDVLFPKTTLTSENPLFFLETLILSTKIGGVDLSQLMCLFRKTRVDPEDALLNIYISLLVPMPVDNGYKTSRELQLFLRF